ncbi:MAG: phosphoribosylglycinamide formyltransferase [Actinomycetota bacterium]|nr:phosphoribosylglycinamide formyltransferase [Actinomycetota bacterium]
MSSSLVVLVSGEGSNLQALVAACDRREVSGEVVAVGADRDCGGVVWAAGRGIPTFVVPFRSPRAKWSSALLERVSNFHPDLVVSAGFMRILSPAFVDACDGRLINLHPSLLPSFPGPHAVRDALAAGVAVTGSTVHFVDHGVDSGPVILQREVPIEPGDTEESLHARIKGAEHELLPEACRLVLFRQSPAQRG